MRSLRRSGGERYDAGSKSLPIFLEGGDDLAVRVREAAFALLLRDRRPVTPHRLAEATGAHQPDVEATLELLAGQGRIDRDEAGRVMGSAGLTLGAGPHRLEIDGQAFRTWCGFDAIGIPAALGVDARIDTQCPVCQGSIGVDLRAGRPVGRTDGVLWLSAGGADMRADFCTPTVLLCSEAHARVWARRQAGRGRALTLDEAVDEGARSWSSAAATAARLDG
ncbi:MAG: hypothetical protein L0221_04690 [Chloroflexi bacterium]|nr:hypothetical protein [Chloroflexota bacterium]